MYDQIKMRRKYCSQVEIIVRDRSISFIAFIVKDMTI